MARHGENIRKRQDGRWEGRYLFYHKEKEKSLYRSVYGKSYEEVKEKLTAKKNYFHQPENGEAVLQEPRALPADKEILFVDAAQEWLAEIRTGRKPSTYAKYHFIYEAHIAPVLQNLLLTQITESFFCEAFVESVSESLQKSIYCVLNQILRFASKRYTLSLPAIKRPACVICRKPIEVLSRKEQSRLFEVLYRKTDNSKAAILLCLYTGLRLGELCALKWEDIDFENRLIAVNRTVQRLAVSDRIQKTALLETEPKSQFSRREVPLSSDALQLVSMLEKKSKYVFGGAAPMEPRTMQYRFKSYLKEAELPEKNFHILRHTFATNCMEGGTDVKSLSEILGHSDVQITLNRYVHPTLDAKRRHLDVLALFYGQIHGQPD